MTDLVTPFFTVFLSETQNEESQTTANSDASLLSNVEADCYWCLCKVLDRVQDHFTYSQPGIQRVCHRVNELVSRLDRRLFSHLTEEDVNVFHFAFRWASCLLLREFSWKTAPRMMASYRVLSGFPTLIVLLIWFSSILGHIYFWRWWSQWLPGIPVYSAFDSLGWSVESERIPRRGFVSTTTSQWILEYYGGGSSVGRSVSVAIHVLLTLGISTIGAGGKYRDGHACTQMSTPVVTVASSRLIYLFGCWQRKIF